MSQETSKQLNLFTCLPPPPPKVEPLSQNEELRLPPRPATFQELCDKHGLAPILRMNVFQPRPGQLKFIEQACASSENIVLWADTNAGKTIAVLAACVPALKAGQRVFIITPRTALIIQGANDARRILNLPDGIAEVLGGPANRLKLYADSAKRLFFITPQSFLNDFKGKRLQISPADIIGIDEAHLLLQGKKAGDNRPKHALGQIAAELSCLANPPRIFAYSATPAADNAQLRELCGLVKARRFIHMESSAPTVEPTPRHVSLESDAELVQAKALLESAALVEAKDMLERLEKAGQIWSGNRQMSELFADLCAEAVKLRSPGQTFKMPIQKELLALQAKFKALYLMLRKNRQVFRSAEAFNKYERFLGGAYSSWCAIENLVHRWSELTSVSRCSFRAAMLERIIAVNFPPADEKEDRLFQKRLYTIKQSWFSTEEPDYENSNTLLGRAFFLIAQSSPAGKIAGLGSWERIWAYFFPGQARNQLTPRQQLDKILQLEQDFSLTTLRPDHPKWEFFEPDLRAHLRRSQDGRVIIFTPLASHALFMARKINLSGYGARAVALVGSDNMTDRQCNLNIAALDAMQVIDGQPTRIAFATTKVNLGVHVPGTDLVVLWSPPNTFDELTQQIGRLTPKDGPGYALSYLSRIKGFEEENPVQPHDQARYQAAIRKSNHMRRSLAGHGDFLFVPQAVR